MSKRIYVALIAVTTVLAADFFDSSSTHTSSLFISDAQAVVGRPLTPVSVAGVARRTTRRQIYRTSTYVASLPPACTTVVIEGTTLQQCGGQYYQSSGNQYVVVNVQ